MQPLSLLLLLLDYSDLARVSWGQLGSAGASWAQLGSPPFFLSGS